MDAETSQRMGYSWNPFDLPEDQAEAVEALIAAAPTFNDIPADALHVLYQMEAKYGVSPLYRDKVEAEQQQIENELDGDETDG